MKKLVIMACMLLVVTTAAIAQTDSTSRTQDPTKQPKPTKTTPNRNTKKQYPDAGNQGNQVNGQQGNQNPWNQQESYQQNQNDSTWASMGRSPEERADLSSMRMQKKLNLSADQTTRIREINLMKAKKADEMRTQYKSQANKTEKGPDFQTLMDEASTEYKAILTPEQYTQWEDMERQHKMKKMDKRQDKMDPNKKNKTPNPNDK